ncbi:MAG: TIM44-like domain-containing protein [Actinomycetota bacterium]
MRKILSALIIAAFAVAGGADAIAKAGSGSSYGSRGSRTADRPIQRSQTPAPSTVQPLAPPSGTLSLPPAGAAKPSGPPPAPSAAPPRTGVESAPLSGNQQPPMYNPGAVRQPGMAGGGMAPMAQQPGFFQRNPFVAGMMGGLVGAGIGSMIFGHSPALAAASDASPLGSMLGLLLQLALVGGIVWLLVRLFRGRREAEAGNPYSPAGRTAAGNPYGQDSRGGNPYMGGGGNPYAAPDHGHREPQLTSVPTTEAPRMVAAAPRVDKEFEPAAGDKEEFGAILQGVQRAWSDGDMRALERLATPEIVHWLSEDLAANTARGVVNRVDNVVLRKGEITESWSENGQDYATAVVTFSCIDTTRRADSGALVEGDPHTPVDYTEAWTFVRRAGGRWMLSAVERE